MKKSQTPPSVQEVWWAAGCKDADGDRRKAGVDLDVLAEVAILVVVRRGSWYQYILRTNLWRIFFVLILQNKIMSLALWLQHETLSLPLSEH